MELHDSAGLTLEQITAVLDAHPDAAIVRLQSGDPSVYGAITEQIAWCVDHQRDFEIVPGVSSLSAAAAAAGRELTVPGLAQSVVLTRLANRTAASVPELESPAAFAAHRADHGPVPLGRPTRCAPGASCCRSVRRTTPTLPP